MKADAIIRDMKSVYICVGTTRIIASLDFKFQTLKNRTFKSFELPKSDRRTFRANL